ncbi:MAG TPA: DUF4249 domain-containing protein [Bacteroidales bacterium]|nr:DUF4249 domain-containing protein [Bacteroidales bacterium]
MKIFLKHMDSTSIIKNTCMLVKPLYLVLLFSVLLVLNGCIVQFLPETNEEQELLVVEGLITDQYGPSTIKLSKSLPLGGRNAARPFEGCNVSISDDLGNNYNLYETVAGTYITNPSDFQGIIGRSYILHISTNASPISLSYRSLPMEMKPVPPMDSIFYEKIAINDGRVGTQIPEGCQIYVNTHDPENVCKFYRWEYSETWEFKLPYLVPNKICWISSSSDQINIKSTASLVEDRINRYPLTFISNMTDRLRVKYSILVNQYSLNEDEYLYWEKLQNISEHIGGLYDITPSSINNNIWCVESPDEKVLGYFSVSASSSKRIFVKDNFKGIIDLYNSCNADTVFGGEPISFLNEFVWVVIDHQMPPPSFKVITYTKGCYDCSVRGTTIEPIFWRDDE